MSSEFFLCVYVREFPAQALLRLRPELRSRPVAVMDGEVPFQQVCALNKEARAMGAIHGMSRAEMDSFPPLLLLKRSLAEERTARTALLACAGSFSPRVEEISLDGQFACVLDISGTEKLFGNPQFLATRLQQSFLDSGVTCSIAGSIDYHTAVCMARGTPSRRSPIIVLAGGQRQALASLPLSVLDMSADHAEAFMQWGVSTLGMLAMLPENDLVARLGQEGQRLRELARGEYPHLFQPLEPLLELEEHLELDSPVDVLDSLLFGVGLMIDQLIARATERITSLATLRTDLGLEDGQIHTRIVRPALPANDKHLWLKLLHLDWIAHPPQAAVLSLRLRAETGEKGTIQLGLFSPQLPEPGRLDVTLARIRAVVGEDRVGCAELKDTHGPDAFGMKPFSVMPVLREKRPDPKLPAVVIRSLRPAEKATMIMSNGSPNLFYFRGTAYDLEKVYGPWRSSGGWWTGDRWSVEEWDIIARARNTIVSDKSVNLLCCSVTHDTVGDHWQVEAMYD